MRRTQPQTDAIRGTRHPSTGRDPADLQAANLGSPVFKEVWDRGSPLDWTEFVTRCNALVHPESD